MNNKISMQRLSEIKREFSLIANEDSMQNDFGVKPSGKIMVLRSYSSGPTIFKKYKV